MPPGAFVTPSQVANFLLISRMTVWRMIKSGDLEAVRVGRQYRIRRRSFDDLVERSGAQPDGG